MTKVEYLCVNLAEFAHPMGRSESVKNPLRLTWHSLILKKEACSQKAQEGTLSRRAPP